MSVETYQGATAPEPPHGRLVNKDMLQAPGWRDLNKGDLSNHPITSSRNEESYLKRLKYFASPN